MCENIYGNQLFPGDLISFSGGAGLSKDQRLVWRPQAFGRRGGSGIPGCLGEKRCDLGSSFPDKSDASVFL